MKNNIKPLPLFLIKGIILILILGSAVRYSDHKGYFTADNTNNHTLRKWNAFYDFTKQNKVDIVLVGNSHLYTGINPKNLSAALGVTSFVLASPGTNIADSYYCLQEAIARCKPQMAIVETYGIADLDLDSLLPGQISDQIQSFDARKNIGLKLLSTPFLFKTENWLYAWSSTIRNHSFLLTNREQIRKNLKTPLKQNPKLYLGRYVRWTKGMADSTLSEYQTLGPVVDGKKYVYSEQAGKYVRKIMELFREHQVKLIFLTLPMYKDHIQNYTHWKNTLAELIDPSVNQWLDLQEPYQEELLTPECFENTRNENQHMTYYGSLICTYQLARYIEAHHGSTLRRQNQDPHWHKTFYGEEGYFENYSPAPDDKENKILLKDTIFESVKVKEADLLKRKNYQSLFIKVDKSQSIPDSLHSHLSAITRIRQNQKVYLVSIRLSYDKAHLTPEHHLYSINLKPDLEIEAILNVTF